MPINKLSKFVVDTHFLLLPAPCRFVARAAAFAAVVVIALPPLHNRYVVARKVAGCKALWSSGALGPCWCYARVCIL